MKKKYKDPERLTFIYQSSCQLLFTAIQPLYFCFKREKQLHAHCWYSCLEFVYLFLKKEGSTS